MDTSCLVHTKWLLVLCSRDNIYEMKHSVANRDTNFCPRFRHASLSIFLPNLGRYAVVANKNQNYVHVLKPVDGGDTL